MTRVLIVDDKEENLYYLQTLLASEGYVVESAQHGAEALVRARRTLPDVIISDLLMPVMDGYTLLRHWKGDARLQRVPFIVYTATYTEPEDERLALELGADAFILKPAEPDDFLKRLREVQAAGVAAAPAQTREDLSGQAAVLQTYNETLIRKLEQKTVQLQESNHALQEDIAARIRSEEATARALQRLNEAQRIGQIGDWEWAPATGEIFWSPQVFEILGRDPLLGPPRDYNENAAAFDEESQALMREKVTLALESGEPQDYELVAYRPSGECVDVLGRAVARKDESGKVIGLFGTIQDITEQKRAEAALKESQQRYRDLFQHMMEGYAYCRAIFDGEELVDFVYLEVNDVFEQLTGLHDVAGKKISELIPDVHRRSRMVMDIYGKAVLSGEPERCETYVDVLESWLSLAVYSTDREHFVVVFDNITERKRTEEALRRSEALFRTLVQTSWDGFHLVDLTGRIIYESPAVTRLLGYEPEELVGRNAVEFFHPDDVAGVNLLDKPSALRSVTLRAQHKDGRWRSMESYRVDLLEHPDVGAIAFNYRDITERIEAETTARRLAAIVESSADAIIGKDTNSIITSWNRGAEKVFGFSEGEMIGESIMRIIPLERHSDEDLIISTTLRGESVENFETQRLTKEGQLIDVAVTVSPIKNNDGKVIGASKVARDITARKKAETAAADLLTILEASLNEIFIFDAETKHFEYVNEAALRNLGYTMEQMRSMRPVDITPEFAPESFAGMTDPLRFHQKPKLVFESEHRRADGTLYPIEAHMQFVERPDRSVFLVVGNDISERKRAELRITEQASLINESRDAIFVRDIDHTVLFWSKGAERVYGWTAAEALGRPVDELIAPDPEATRLALGAVFGTGEWNGEISKETKAGLRLMVESRWTLLRDDRGEIKSILVIDTDVTERKQLEQQFFRAQRLESIGTLASGLAHDLNNILAPILMCAPLLRKQLPPEKADRLIRTIEASAGRGAQIIGQVLTFGLGAEGERKPLQLEEVISEVVQIARETFPKNIQIESRVAPQLARINGDATQWHQVLLNLSVNARDAMPNGGELRISAENLAVDANYASMTAGLSEGPHVVLDVTDSGSGIPADVAERIFDPFFTTKEVGKGTGLGLSTALGIIRSHNAVINLETPPGGGTTFRIIIPTAFAGATDTKASTAATVAPGGHGELILIVDDEENVRNAVHTVLELNGYRTLLAKDGTEGLALFAQNATTVKAVLTDINMPHINGVMLTRALQIMQPSIPVIASTGQAGSGSLAELQSLGIESLLKKPYSADVLLRTLQSALKNGK